MLHRPIFIGGMPRSGTTLLRAMIDRHPAIACGPELRTFPALATISSQTRKAYGDVFEQFYGLTGPAYDDAWRTFMASFLEPYLASRGKKRIAEKTPANVLHFHEFARLFPDADFINVVRDGRDVVASLQNMNWTDPATGQPMEITRDPAAASATWKAHIDAGTHATKNLPRVHEIRYENLITAPECELRALTSFLREDWCDDMLHHHKGDHLRAGVDEASAPQIAKPLYSTAIGKWKSALSDGAKKLIKSTAGPTLIHLGYTDNNDW